MYQSHKWNKLQYLIKPNSEKAKTDMEVLTRYRRNFDPRDVTNVLLSHFCCLNFEARESPGTLSGKVGKVELFVFSSSRLWTTSYPETFVFEWPFEVDVGKKQTRPRFWTNQMMPKKWNENKRKWSATFTSSLAQVTLKLNNKFQANVNICVLPLEISVSKQINRTKCCFMTKKTHFRRTLQTIYFHSEITVLKRIHLM